MYLTILQTLNFTIHVDLNVQFQLVLCIRRLIDQFNSILIKDIKSIDDKIEKYFQEFEGKSQDISALRCLSIIGLARLTLQDLIYEANNFSQVKKKKIFTNC